MREEQPLFWQLTSPDTTRGLAEWIGDEIELAGVDCPVNPEHARSGKRLTDLSVLLTSKRITDFVWTWYSECLIQDRVLHLFREEGFTGFEARSAKARMKTDATYPDPCGKNTGPGEGDVAQTKIPRLWELVVTGWGGIAPPESGIHVVENCPACGFLEYTDFDDPSLLIDSDQWDGSDFFIVWPLPRFIFVTDRVARFVKTRRLTGAGLHSPEALQRGPLGGLAPGRLSYYMPEARARELGEPHGIY